MSQKVVAKDFFSVKVLNFIFSGLLILSNIIVLIPFSFLILQAGGGPFSFGILLLPFQIIFHLYLIPSIICLKNKNQHNRTYTWINGIGSTVAIFWSILILNSLKSYQHLFQ